MRVLRSPVTWFLLVALALTTAIAIGTDFLARRAATEEAIGQARDTTELLARSVAEPNVTKPLVAGKPGGLDKFVREVQDRLLVGDVRNYDIRTPNGRIVFSNQVDLIGDVVPLDADQREVLRTNGTGDDTSPRQLFDSSGEPPQVATYTTLQVGQHGGQTLLFETYVATSEIAQRRHEIFGAFRWLTLAPLLLLIGVVTAMLWVLTGRLARVGAERERLLRQAIDASDAERRRIARDLHDGVVQDLAGAAFSVSALARDPGTPGSGRSTLAGVGRSLRDSLTALRSLLAEIHPPDLRADGLSAALEDLVAPATAAGLHTSVEVAHAERATDEEARLVWRVAQEAVRNALRHAGASRLDVRVDEVDGRLVLEVTDDGAGFEPERVRETDRYGLRGLRSLVADSGGRLDVRSFPGSGTTVRMEVHQQ